LPIKTDCNEIIANENQLQKMAGNKHGTGIACFTRAQSISQAHKPVNYLTLIHFTSAQAPQHFTNSQGFS